MSSKSLDHYVVSAEALERDKEDKSLDSQELVLRVGRLLHATIIAKDVSPACLAAIERMAVSGEILGLQFVEEIKRSGALTKSTNSNWGILRRRFALVTLLLSEQYV
ncbi:unnamed protein product [Phytophthora lilii]|uniref:Unnamed protein product n=1 Tax=Phytophthora lilii TaxID=2077276 RepID=A0A9W6TBQ1_9STRA|nr:unnamed protein product [Phytophthora lilii]